MLPAVAFWKCLPWERPGLQQPHHIPSTPPFAEEMVRWQGLLFVALGIKEGFTPLGNLCATELHPSQQSFEVRLSLSL